MQSNIKKKDSHDPNGLKAIEKKNEKSRGQDCGFSLREKYEEKSKKMHEKSFLTIEPEENFP